MNVLMVSEFYPPDAKGGGEISAHFLAKALAESGIAVHVLTSGKGHVEILDKVHVHRLLATNDPTTLKGNFLRQLLFEKSLLAKARVLMKRMNFDVVHCMGTTSIPLIKLKKEFHARFILHVNSPVMFCPKGTLMYKDEDVCERECTTGTFLGCVLGSKTLGKMALSPFIKYNPLAIAMIRNRYLNNKKLMRLFDNYTPISTYMKELLLKNKIPEKKIEIVYNIMGLERFKPAKEKKNRIKKILYLGEYSMAKGTQALMETLKSIDAKVEASFYGDGNLRDWLASEASGARSTITINEKVAYEKIPEIIQTHDILVVPSLVAEAFGRVVIEGLASGKVVVCCDIGGLGKDIESKRLIRYKIGGLKGALECAISLEVKQDKLDLTAFEKDSIVKKVKRLYGARK
ncbi:MAG: glycosyltransferase family 4 protein [Nanoarchaeota archaeon]|nr:glycosyltransferase family 4 protein [Nanoarchaeota archaeon]